MYIRLLNLTINSLRHFGKEGGAPFYLELKKKNLKVNRFIAALFIYLLATGKIGGTAVYFANANKNSKIEISVQKRLAHIVYRSN